MKARAWCFRAALCLVGVHVVLWRWLAWQGDGAGTPTVYLWLSAHADEDAAPGLDENNVVYMLEPIRGTLARGLAPYATIVEGAGPESFAAETTGAAAGDVVVVVSFYNGRAMRDAARAARARGARTVYYQTEPLYGPGAPACHSSGAIAARAVVDDVDDVDDDDDDADDADDGGPRAPPEAETPAYDEVWDYSHANVASCVEGDRAAGRSAMTRRFVPPGYVDGVFSSRSLAGRQTGCDSTCLQHECLPTTFREERIRATERGASRSWEAPAQVARRPRRSARQPEGPLPGLVRRGALWAPVPRPTQEAPESDGGQRPEDGLRQVERRRGRRGDRGL